MLSPVVSPSSKGSSAGKSKGFRFSPPVSEPETPVEPINPFKNIPLKKHNSILNILANTYDNNALHTNIYTGTKTFFRPYVKVDIDIIFHHKPKCLEVICYNCTTEMEAKPRLYLLYSEVLKRVIQTPEYQLKVKQLLVRSGKPAETASMDNKILSEAVQYVLISNFILNRLSIRKTSKVSKDIPSSTNSSSSHAQWNGNNKRVRNENDLSPGVNMVTDEEFVVDIVRLPIDKPSMAISVKNNVLTKNSDLKYTPSHHNDIEWCCQFIQENDTVDANKTKSVSKKNSGDTNGKVENDMKPEEHTRPLGIERVHIPRYHCEEDSDMDDDGNSEAFMAGAISLPLDGSATNENASGIVVDAGPNAFYEDDGYDDEGNGYYLGIQNKLDTGSAYISRPITPKGAGRSALFGRKNSTSIPGLVTSGSRASTPLPPIYASKSASRSLAGSRESKKTHRQLANQYTAQSPALSLESRLARQQELNALRFNASDNMFVPGGKAK